MHNLWRTNYNNDNFAASEASPFVRRELYSPCSANIALNRGTFGFFRAPLFVRVPTQSAGDALRLNSSTAPRILAIRVPTPPFVYRRHQNGLLALCP